MRFLFDTRNEFDPQRVAGVARAFKAALSSITEHDYPEIPALDLRRIVASGIIAEAQRGENDPVRLRHAGIEALRRPLGCRHLGCLDGSS